MTDQLCVQQYYETPTKNMCLSESQSVEKMNNSAKVEEKALALSSSRDFTIQTSFHAGDSH